MENAKRNKPGAAEMLRSCSYDPSKDMIEVTYKDGPEQKQLYLEVKYRVKWFNQFCAENGISGMIDDSEVTYIPEAHIFVATATVYMGGEPVGRSSAGAFAGDDSLSTAIQTACTRAKGRALANAGFGTVNSALEDGDRLPCDSGITISGGKVVAAPDNPMNVRVVEEKPEKSANPDGGKDTQPRETAGDDEGSKLPTLEEALATVLPFGRYRGKCLGEAMGIQPNIADFYAGPNFSPEPKYEYLKKAAQVIVNSRAKN